MRLAQMWCDFGVRQKNTQIAIEPTLTLKVCRWNPHFCQDLARHSQAIHPDFLDLFRLKGLQLMSITIEGPCCRMDDVCAPSCVIGFSFQKIVYEGIQEVGTKTISSRLIWVEYELNLKLFYLNIVRSGSVHSGLQLTTSWPTAPTLHVPIRGVHQLYFDLNPFHSLSGQKPTLWHHEFVSISSWFFVGVGSANAFE